MYSLKHGWLHIALPAAQLQANDLKTTRAAAASCEITRKMAARTSVQWQYLWLRYKVVRCSFYMRAQSPCYGAKGWKQVLGPCIFSDWMHCVCYFDRIQQNTSTIMHIENNLWASPDVHYNSSSVSVDCTSCCFDKKSKIQSNKTSFEDHFAPKVKKNHINYNIKHPQLLLPYFLWVHTTYSIWKSLKCFISPFYVCFVVVVALIYFDFLNSGLTYKWDFDLNIK